eukprot:7679455-Ditylum_brightwellii.AAC.1
MSGTGRMTMLETIKIHKNKTATCKLTREKQKQKNVGVITGKLGKSGVNINMQADEKKAQEMMKEQGEMPVKRKRATEHL